MARPQFERRKVALCLPTDWAPKVLQQLISFGSGFGAAILPLIMLGRLEAAANLLAA